MGRERVMMMTGVRRVAVIGTACRKADQLARMDASKYSKMVEAVKEQIVGVWGLDRKNTVLVSGGSAWADHVAVTLYLSAPDAWGGLELHLPCPLDFKTRAYMQTGAGSWFRDPGRSLNLYHRQQSRKLGRSTLNDLITAQAVGALVRDDYKGFHVRNSAVAKSANYMVALTFSPSAVGEPDSSSSGTRDTWNKSTAQKSHISVANDGGVV